MDAHLKIDIRLATPEDATVVAQVHVRAWQVGYRNLLPDERAMVCGEPPLYGARPLKRSGTAVISVQLRSEPAPGRECVKTH